MKVLALYVLDPNGIENKNTIKSPNRTRQKA
jgi:hypothetical protein